MRIAIERYLSLTLGDNEPDHDRLQVLAWALDDLLLGLRSFPTAEPTEDDAEPPQMDHQSVHAEVGRRFPELGFYPAADPLDLESEEVLVGDAVDDAADIAIDLAEVIWRWDHLSKDDAAWCLHFGFKTHWGQHLMDLRRHLHALMWRDPEAALP